MRRCVPLVLPLLALGCQHEEPAASRVRLPEGVARPRGLRPDPPALPPLTPPASKIERSPPLVPPVQGASVLATFGTPTTPGVEGACEYGEAEVACWNGAGAADARLSAQVRAALASGVGGTSLPVVVGRKGRIAVALTPKEPTDGGIHWSVEAIHPAESSSSPGLGSAPDGRTRSLVLLSEDARASTGSLRFTERRRLPKEVSVSLKPGASASLGGCRLTVTKIDKLGAADEDRFFFQDRPSWRILVLRSGKPPHDEEFFPVDPYSVYAFEGRRAKLDPSGKIVFAPKDAPKVTTLTYSELPEGAVAVLLDRDPAKVKRLTLGGSEVRSTILDGVPLDAKAPKETP